MLTPCSATKNVATVLASDCRAAHPSTVLLNIVSGEVMWKPPLSADTPSMRLLSVQSGASSSARIKVCMPRVVPYRCQLRPPYLRFITSATCAKISSSVHGACVLGLVIPENFASASLTVTIASAALSDGWRTSHNARLRARATVLLSPQRCGPPVMA